MSMQYGVRSDWAPNERAFAMGKASKSELNGDQNGLTRLREEVEALGDVVETLNDRLDNLTQKVRALQGESIEPQNDLKNPSRLSRWKWRPSATLMMALLYLIGIVAGVVALASGALQLK